jgi:hypothetical protein
MRSCRWTTPGPVAVGSRYEQMSEFLGRRVHTSFEVIEHEPGHRVTIQSREGSSFPIKVTRIVEPRAEGGSHVIELVEGDASGFYTIAAPLLRAMVARNVRRDYRNLKRVLERVA